MRAPYSETTIHKQIRKKRENRKERIMQDVEEYGKDVLESDEMKQAYEQTHHLWSTVGEHTLRVTMSSVMICYALRKLHIKANVPAVIVGSLCHDLGILGRKDKFSSNKEMSREHPVESVKVARELVEDLSDESADIIERHMWPAGESKVPNSLEGVIVSVADKYTAVKDLVKGSDVKQTGIVNTAHQKSEQFKETLQREIHISDLYEADPADTAAASVNTTDTVAADIAERSDNCDTADPHAEIIDMPAFAENTEISGDSDNTDIDE